MKIIILNLNYFIIVISKEKVLKIEDFYELISVLLLLSLLFD
jgi:hypothetical protein